MGLIETFIGWFKHNPVQDATTTNLKNKTGSDKPETGSAITNPDDGFSYIQQNDYWGNKIKKELYVDGKDQKRYEDFDHMDDEVPEIRAALDVNADYIIYPNTDDDESRVVKVMCDEEDIQAKIDEIETRVSVQEKLFPMVRAMLKYGDNVEELVTNVEGNKFLGFRNIPVQTIVPIMINGFPMTVGDVMAQQVDGTVRVVFKDTEVFHLCLSTDRKRFTKYGKGTSILEGSRLLYKQVKLMEEGMMITRLSRANQNYAMIVDVGELQGEDALNFLDKYKKRIMRRKYIDPRTGAWSWDYNPLSVIEDIMVPTRQGSGGNVVPLNNTANANKDIDDIQYCQDKLIFSTGTPKLLIGKEIDINSKSTSDNQISSFLRRIRRIQTIISPAIKKLYKNILHIEGIEVNENDLRILWPSGLTVDEERKATIAKLRAQVAQILKTDMLVVDDFYVYTKILGMTDKEAHEMENRVNTMREEQLEIKRQNLELQAEFSNKNNNNWGNNSGNTGGLGGNSTDVAGDTDSDGDDENKGNSIRRSKKKLPKKQELLNIMKGKLTEKQYSEWQKHMEMCDKNPDLKAGVLALIDILQAYDGN